MTRADLWRSVYLLSACLWRWLRVAWVCRVGVASCIIGFLLLRYVTQARDLFLDFPSFDSSGTSHLDSYLTMAGYALRFGLLLTVFWALPVHATARLALNRSEWLSSPFGSACGPADVDAARALFATPVALIPRLLGISCFVAAGLSVVQTMNDLLPTDDRVLTRDFTTTALRMYLASIVMFGVIFTIFSFWRRDWLARALRHRTPAGGEPTPSRPRVQPRPAVADGRAAAGLIDVVDSWIVRIVFVLLVLILAIPDALDYFPRLSLVPLLLGAWVPLLAWLGRMSYVTRMPLIAMTIALVAVVTYRIGDNHDVFPKKDAQARQIDLREAVAAWKKANCSQDGKICPSPIIVTSAGGASRAAFMTVSALGLLLDASCLDTAHRTEAPAGHDATSCTEAPAFGRRLFAISSVSGGSLGAAVYARAYFDGQQSGQSSPVGDSPRVSVPCKHGAPNLWPGDPGSGWRTCLQAIVAEDFLSPVFAGLGFRDVFSFIGKLTEESCPNFWPDRGRRMEQAWTNAYATYVSSAAIEQHPFECNTPPSDAGLAAGFTQLAPVEGAWRPLLLLNATSVDTGRRVIASHIAPDYRSKPDDSADLQKSPCVRLFSDAYDLNESESAPKGGPRVPCARAELNDLTLAGAAHNSARFPVVSPAGNLMPDGPRGASAGRVVDGGYFDNYGALTAFDLADSLRWEYDLYPFVLLITNDLSDNADAQADGSIKPQQYPWYSQPPHKIDPAAQIFASVLAAPVDTVLAVRSGHGSTAIKLMRGLIDPAVYQTTDCARKKSGDDARQNEQCAAPRGADVKTTCFDILGDERDSMNLATPVRRQEPCFAHVGVFADKDDKSATVTDISMSWWLSKPVQEYLSAQLAKDANLRAFDLVCAAIARGWPKDTDKDMQDRESACRKQVRAMAISLQPEIPSSSR